MSENIDYGNLMHQAMRDLIKQVLHGVKDNGLPGDHHFFITFDTEHPEVEIPGWLTERYPNEMTVVMQHWYDGLDVTENGFYVTLNFGDTPAPLYIPYGALKTFVDPSVEFGLKFENQSDETAEPVGPDDSLLGKLELSGDDAEEKAPAAEVVSLDSFRK
tara:strand:- start:329 stop:808 length:480 start_codon:yes stop_codon:yes gene_type:complete